MRFQTYINLHLYIEQFVKEVGLLIPRDIVLASLPWACDAVYANLLRWDIPAPNSAYYPRTAPETVLQGPFLLDERRSGWG